MDLNGQQRNFNKKKAEELSLSAFFLSKKFLVLIFYLLLLLFLANPANPTNPEPKSSIVAGSGTGVVENPAREKSLRYMPVMSAPEKV